MSHATRITTTTLVLALILIAFSIPRAARAGDAEPPSNEVKLAARSRANTLTDATRITNTPRASLATEAAEASPPRASATAPKKQWVWLEKQGVWGYGYQIEEGPHRGLWRIDPESKQPPAPVEPPADPYRFTQILNRIRATVGLAPVAYDHELSAWAAQNNAAQCNRGLGHHVNPNCYQNCAWNTPEADSTVNTWLNSPGHRENLLAPDITRVGIAFGPGPYWTMNAR